MLAACWLVLTGLAPARPAAAQSEPYLVGPHPFEKDNALALAGGYALANGFDGVRAGLDYGYELAGSLWLDLRLEVVDASAGVPPSGGASPADPAEVETFAAVLAGLEYKLRTQIPLVPYFGANVGPVFLFYRGAQGAVGIAVRASAGARYFLYDWLGFGLEVGLLLGAAAVDEEAGLDSALRMLDLGLVAEVQF